MNRQAQALAAKIEAKKREIRTYADAGKVAEVKKAKKELDDLQAMFEAVRDLDDDAEAAAGAAAGAGTAQVIDGSGKNDHETEDRGVCGRSDRRDQTQTGRCGTH